MIILIIILSIELEHFLDIFYLKTLTSFNPFIGELLSLMNSAYSELRNWILYFFDQLLINKVVLLLLLEMI